MMRKALRKQKPEESKRVEHARCEVCLAGAISGQAYDDLLRTGALMH